jgi:hypothetical protein
MIKNMTFVVLMISWTVTVHTQNLDTEALEQLVYHADVMTHAEESKHRLYSMDVFNETFRSLLKQTHSFDYSFDELKWISKMIPEDNSFRIFTWEVVVSENEYKYFGILQKSDGTLFELTDDFAHAEDLLTEEFGHENWLGAIYYNMMDINHGSGEKYYLLFGLNKWNSGENIKIADVLFFSREGIPYFGKPVFKWSAEGMPDVFHNRILTRYASDAQVSLNYNPGMAMIITDHLVRRMSRLPGQAETMVPDGSYIAYEYKNDYWNRIDQLENQILDSAPRPVPVLDDRQNKTITGQEKVKKKNK